MLTHIKRAPRKCSVGCSIHVRLLHATTSRKIIAAPNVMLEHDEKNGNVLTGKRIH